MVAKDHIIVAISNDDFVEPVGSVMCDKNFDKEKHLADLGMLCVKEDQTGKGIGKLLILESEKRSKEMGCTTMRLEILSPRDWKHPTKTWLDVWYTQKMGYTKGALEDFTECFPEHAARLKDPCVFTTYHKDI